MMGSDFHFRDKIPIAVLGATTEMGQSLVRFLIHHPWFEIIALGDSNDGIDQPYGKVIPSHLSPLPEKIENMQVQSCEIPFPCSLIFSTLPPQEAMIKELRLAAAGYYIVSCASYPLNSDVPLIVAEINHDQLALIQRQHGGKGGIVSNPNSIAIGLSLVLRPLMEKFGLEDVQVIASQAFDDAHVAEEENHKIEQQTLRILGQLQEEDIQKADFKINVQNQRVLDLANDQASVSLKFKRKVNLEEVIQAWGKFGSELQRLQLPTAPYHILYYLDPSHESRKHFLDKKMSIYLEHLHPSSVLDYQFDLFFSHLMRGVIGSMLLNAELLVVQGRIYW